MTSILDLVSQQAVKDLRDAEDRKFLDLIRAAVSDTEVAKTRDALANECPAPKGWAFAELPGMSIVNPKALRPDPGNRLLSWRNMTLDPAARLRQAQLFDRVRFTDHAQRSRPPDHH